MRDEGRARPDDVLPIDDAELRDEELYRQSSVKACCGAPGCHSLCPVFPSGVQDNGVDAPPSEG
jgi:hypothetical protein